MKIVATRGLECLTDRVESDLEKVLEERDMLGLSYPGDFNVKVGYYMGSCMASAFVEDSMPTIQLNTLPIVFERFNNKEKDYAHKIISYFDVAQELFHDCEEDLVLNLMEHPLKTINEVEGDFGKKGLKEFKESFGDMYKKYRSAVIKYAKDARLASREVFPKIISVLDNTGFTSSPLRHEMDHLDMYHTRLNKDYYAIEQRLGELKNEIWSGDSETIKEYKRLSRKFIDMKTKVVVIEEIRAAFFDQIKMGEWMKIDYEEVKRKVYGWFHNSYIINNFQKDILECTLGDMTGLKDLGKNTINYLRRLTLEHEGNAGSGKYHEDRTKVDYNIANKILFEDIPTWQMRFAQNAAFATEAIGNAFRDDPTRFQEANKARSFDEYLRILED